MLLDEQLSQEQRLISRCRVLDHDGPLAAITFIKKNKRFMSSVEEVVAAYQKKESAVPAANANAPGTGPSTVPATAAPGIGSA